MKSQINIPYILLNMKVKVKSLCLTKHHAMKMHWGGGIAPHTLDVGTKRWVVSFTYRLFYPTYPMDGWTPELVWMQWRREKFPAPARTWTPEPWLSGP